MFHNNFDSPELFDAADDARAEWIHARVQEMLAEDVELMIERTPRRELDLKFRAAGEYDTAARDFADY